jgi:3-phenylpropionate/trans-cinnamate dioxygenase ferredoxin reductase subunit
VSEARRLVIVGAGHGGVQVAVSLRQGNFDGSITLLSDEAHLPYHRPPLSKLDRKSDTIAVVPLRSAKFFAEHEIELRAEAATVEVDREARMVRLATGDAVEYEHLVLATGARARRLDCVDDSIDGVYHLRALGDSCEMWERIRTSKDVVIVGGGFLGLEVAAGARKLGCSVVVVENAPRLMERAVSAPVSAFLESYHRAHGVDFLLEDSLECIEARTAQVTGVRTRRGRHLEADTVLISVGAEPNTALAEGAGLVVDRGIVVDRHLCTSDARVSAIGDCARWNTINGVSLRLESVQNAVDQARCVADRIVGRTYAYDSVAWFWSEQGQCRLQMAGLGSVDDEVVLRSDEHVEGIAAFRFRAGALTSVETVDQPDIHMAARRLLERGVTITPSHVRDPRVDLKALARDSAEPAPLLTVET